MKKNKLIRLLEDYTFEKEFSMIYKNNNLNVINYTRILDFSSTLISFEYKDKSYYIEGNNLVITKMLSNEMLITGSINKITFI